MQNIPPSARVLQAKGTGRQLTQDVKDQNSKGLTHDDASLIRPHKADLLGCDDLIGGFILEHAVLVDAALVRKGIRAHNGLHRTPVLSFRSSVRR